MKNLTLTTTFATLQLLVNLTLGVAQVTFTGNAATDFTACGCGLHVDQTDLVGDLGNVCRTLPNGGFSPKGFDAQHIFMHHDPVSDTLYIGIDMVGVAGDADGDGDPSTSNNCPSADPLSTPMHSHEAIGFSIDTDQDGKWDYYIGWPLGGANFDLYQFINSSSDFSPSIGRLQTMPNTTPVSLRPLLYSEPSPAKPDPEFFLASLSLLDPDLMMNMVLYTQPVPGGGDVAFMNNIDFQASLPVEFTSFEAHQQADNIILTWETVSEVNNSGFAVEMADASEEFVEIGFVAGQGTSRTSEAYHFEVQDAHRGWNYFRLKQIDFNGEFHYSDYVAVEMSTQKISVTATIADNTLYLTSYGQSPMSFHLVNMAGQRMHQGTVDDLTEMDVNHLATGLYFVQFETVHGIVSKRFVKQ